MFKRDGKWWVSITFRGRRIRKSTETSNLELAKAIEGKIRTQLITGEYFDRCEGEGKTFKDMAEKRNVSMKIRHFINEFSVFSQRIFPV